MSLYTRKLWRELRAQKGQSLAIAGVTALGVFLFLSCAAGYLDLRDSYADTRARLALADWHLDVTSVSEAEVASARKLPHVGVAEARSVVELPARIGDMAAPSTAERPAQAGADATRSTAAVSAPAGDAAKVTLRLLSLPDEGEPQLDRVLLLDGALPSGADEVLLEKHVAQHFELKAGDEVTIETPSTTRRLRVSGVAVSAEYLWVSRDESDIMPSPSSFGVGWMRGSAERTLAAAAQIPVATQLLIEASDAAGRDAALTEVRALLGTERVHRAVSEEHLVGARLLQLDVDGYKGMALFFPIFFLGVAAFIVASALSRRVDAQRAIIGTFAALGVSQGRILRHYLAAAVWLTGTGALIGVALGLASGRAMTQEYAKELGIPFVTSTFHWGLALAGLGMGLAVALLAGGPPAWRASRLHPAESMRPARPSTGVLARWARHLRAPLSVRMALRSVLGRPFRSLTTALGVSAALVMLVTTGGLLDSMKQVLDVIFTDANRYDVRVDLAAPESFAQVQRRLGAIEGVSEVEGIITAPARLSANDAHQDVLVQALPPKGELLRSMNLEGQQVQPRSGGIVLTHAVAKALKVTPGDTVRAELALGGPTHELRVDGLADAALGPVATVTLSDARAALGSSDAVTTVLVRAMPGRAEAVRQRLSEWPQAAHVQDLHGLREQMGGLMGLGLLMLGMMLAFSVALAAAILFNTATLNILERQRELATLRAMGRTVRELAVGLTFEHAVIAVLGAAIGVPMAVWATHAVMALYSSDLFRLPFAISPTTWIASAVAVVTVLIVAQWPALRQVARASLADAVRTREG